MLAQLGNVVDLVARHVVALQSRAFSSEPQKSPVGIDRAADSGCEWPICDKFAARCRSPDSLGDIGDRLVGVRQADVCTASEVRHASPVAVGHHVFPAMRARKGGISS